MVSGRIADRQGNCTMNREGNLHSYTLITVSVILAAIFIYAGVEKIRSPLDFADNIQGFAILPLALVVPMALALPFFEIASGLLMLTPWTRRVAALGIAIITAMFIVALGSALARGLTLDCGCFGVGAPSRTRMWAELGLDIVLFAVSLSIYLRLFIGSQASAANNALAA